MKNKIAAIRKWIEDNDNYNSFDYNLITTLTDEIDKLENELDDLTVALDLYAGYTSKKFLECENLYDEAKFEIIEQLYKKLDLETLQSLLNEH